MSTQAQVQAQALASNNAHATSGLTRGQVRWAQEHNWFVDWALVDGKLVVYTRAVVSNLAGETWVDNREFSNWQELLAWAGY